MNRTGSLSSTDATGLAARIITDALARAAAADVHFSLEDVAEAIGFGAGTRGAPVSAMKAGIKVLSLPKIVQLIVNKPRVGHAFVSVLAEFCVARMCEGAPASRIAALDALIAAVLDLAAVGCTARADNVVDDIEGARIAGKVEAVKRCADVFVSTLAVAAAPVAAANGWRR